jgi:hypothetical protein
MGDVEGEVDVDEEEELSEEDGGESDDEGIDDLKRIYFKSVPEGDEGGKTTYLRKVSGSCPAAPAGSLCPLCLLPAVAATTSHFDLTRRHSDRLDRSARS